MSTMHPNSLARSYAFKFLYQIHFDDLKELKETLETAILEFDQSFEASDHEHLDNQASEEAKRYAKELIHGVVHHLEDLQKAISSTASNWKIERMAKVDLSLLYVACYEILYVDSVPSNVTINEVVELAKKYGEEQSYSFINGLLNKISKDK